MVCYRTFLGLLLALACATVAQAFSIAPATLSDLTTGAARVVRARCVAAEPGVAAFAGGRVAATTYTFEVTEALKGGDAGRVTFRQVGVPSGGPRDLGARVGLPAYVPGVEYVLFLLPESGAGLTSPAGAGQGAFVVRHERAFPLHGPVVLDADAKPAAPGRAKPAPGLVETVPIEAIPYEELRRAVLDRVAR